MPTALPALTRDQTLGEEIANSTSHGVAVVAGIVGTPVLIVQAVRHGSAAFVVGVCLFAASILILYLASTLYHALPPGKAKRVFRVLDHASIYLLIAGTYTPFTLGVLRGGWGWSLFGVIWGLALAGVTLKALGKVSHPALSTGIYLLMGWLVVVAAQPMMARVPLPGLLWLLAGGLCYTGGVVFYNRDAHWRYAHFVWHLFVLAGTVCHYVAVLGYAA